MLVRIEDRQPSAKIFQSHTTMLYDRDNVGCRIFYPEYNTAIQKGQRDVYDVIAADILECIFDERKKEHRLYHIVQDFLVQIKCELQLV